MFKARPNRASLEVGPVWPRVELQTPTFVLQLQLQVTILTIGNGEQGGFVAGHALQSSLICTLL